MEEFTYEEIVTEIENKRRFGSLAGVRITGQMLEKLSHPESGLPVIHIAGTNGKGSVAAFLSSILKETGRKVGTFTSPHLVDFRERIMVNGEMISKEAVKRIGLDLLHTDFGVHPTMFDYCLVMAVLYFKERGCDAAVIETGLGGRLDSTNALGVPKVCVITKIGYDHMEVLGDTLEKIAAEKAGIIKKGVRLVMESQEYAVRQVLCEAAERAGAVRQRTVIPGELHIESGGKEGQVFSFRGYSHLKMKLLGVHQYENAAAAILAAEEFFEESGMREFSKEAWKHCVERGISNTVWPGRMEILRKEPFFMVDGAHNSHGAAALRKSLEQLFPGERFHFIMGVMADKDYRQMIRELEPLAIDFKTVTVENGRALMAEQIAACVRESGQKAECGESLEAVLAEQEEQGLKTVAFGSLYFIGEIKAIFRQKLQNGYESASLLQK